MICFDGMKIYMKIEVCKRIWINKWKGVGMFGFFCFWFCILLFLKLNKGFGKVII